MATEGFYEEQGHLKSTNLEGLSNKLQEITTRVNALDSMADGTALNSIRMKRFDVHALESHESFARVSQDVLFFSSNHELVEEAMKIEEGITARAGSTVGLASIEEFYNF